MRPCTELSSKYNNIVLYLFFLFLLSQNGQSWDWPFSSKESVAAGENPSKNAAVSGDVVVDFTMESGSNQKGIQLVENAREKMVVSNSCWQNAYGNLLAGCSKILADEENRFRLAWHLSDCFQKDSSDCFLSLHPPRRRHSSLRSGCSRHTSTPYRSRRCRKLLMPFLRSG
ncbi:hypothetical protein U1Q18_033160 [Sarracenia purpurea var. burkii]